MKFNMNYLFVAIIFLIVIIMSLGCSCSRVSPYYKDNLFTHEYKYEGFGALNSKMTSGSGDGGNVKIISGSKVEGFEGLQTSPYTAETPIDVFSQATGNNQCAPNPYSNSKGYLCLDKTQKELLNSRGGNSTGKDSEIGPQ